METCTGQLESKYVLKHRFKNTADYFTRHKRNHSSHTLEDFTVEVEIVESNHSSIHIKILLLKLQRVDSNQIYGLHL